jgi:hypothetical protein
MTQLEQQQWGLSPPNLLASPGNERMTREAFLQHNLGDVMGDRSGPLSEPPLQQQLLGHPTLLQSNLASQQSRSSLLDSAGYSGAASMTDDNLLSSFMFLRRQQALASGLQEPGGPIAAQASASSPMAPNPAFNPLFGGAQFPSVDSSMIGHATSVDDALRLYNLQNRQLAQALQGAQSLPSPQMTFPGATGGQQQQQFGMGGGLFSGPEYQSQLQNLANRNLPNYHMPPRQGPFASEFGELPERIERPYQIPPQEAFGGPARKRDFPTEPKFLEDHAPKKKKQRKAGRKKPADMPRRPLSAYNLFFSEGKLLQMRHCYNHDTSETHSGMSYSITERDRILKELNGPLGMVEVGSSPATLREEQKPEAATQEDAGEGAQPNIKALQRPLVRTGKERRVHRKTHGKISFQELARMVGQRWKTISDERRKYYQDLADKDLIRHRKAMEEYYKKNRGGDEEEVAKEGKKTSTEATVKEKQGETEGSVASASSGVEDDEQIEVT